MSRTIALIYGLTAVSATFLYTIGFVEDVLGRKTNDSGPAARVWTAVLIDLLRCGFKRWWTRIVPPAVERSTFVLAASFAVILLIWQWRPIRENVWVVSTHEGRTLLIDLSGLGWAVLLVVSTFVINHFELFDVHQVANNLAGRGMPAPPFRTPLFYSYVRHSISPAMTVSHLLFVAVTTTYVFVGILFGERNLIEVFGDEYRRY